MPCISLFLAKCCHASPWLAKAQGCSFSPRWCCFSCNAGWQTAFVSFLALTHQDDGPSFGLRQSNYYQFHWYLNLGGTPLELVYYGYPLSTYCTGSFEVFSDQRSHIHASIQSILIEYWYSTSFQSFARFQDIQGSYSSRELSRLPVQHNSLASPCHKCTWLLFYELLSQFYSGNASGVRLGRVHWNTISPLLILGQYWAFRVLIFFLVWYRYSTPVLVDLLHLVLHARLCQSHELQYRVLRDTDQTIPLHESFQQRLLLTSAISLLYLR